MNTSQSSAGLKRWAFKVAATAGYWRVGRDRWRWLVRRWTFALLGFTAGLMVLIVWQFEAFSALWHQKDEVHELHLKLAVLKRQVANAQTPSDAPQGPSALMARLPDRDRQALIWLNFSRLLTQHGVHLQSLRPVPNAVPAPLASQAVAVRLQADFDDWVAVWTALNAQSPAWSVDRLRIAPQGESLAIEAVLRVWFGDGSDISVGTLTNPTTPSESPLARGQSSVFWQESHAFALVQPVRIVDVDHRESTEQSGAAGQAHLANPVAANLALGPPDAPNFSADPLHWPLDRIRLLGVWHHAQDSQAILSAGPHWIQARAGQRLGPMGHRVDHIDAHEVHLRAHQGPVKVLGLTEVLP